jgi:hypothetical protein
MARIFNTIRQRLLAQNRLTRYLVYAIGEIVLVVIGILIALQINLWNEGRKDRVKEQVVLHRLLEEFNSNLAQLDDKIQIRENIIEASTAALGYMDHPEGVQRDSLMAKVTTTTMTPTFDPIINDLVSSGNIRLIRNQQLNRLLTEWPTYVIQLAELEQEHVDNYRRILAPTFIQMGISRDLNHLYSSSEKNYSYLLDKVERSELPTTSDSPQPVPLGDLLNSKELEGILSNAMFISHLANMESRSLRTRIMEILTLLKQEIRTDA